MAASYFCVKKQQFHSIECIFRYRTLYWTIWKIYTSLKSFLTSTELDFYTLQSSHKDISSCLLFASIDLCWRSFYSTCSDTPSPLRPLVLRCSFCFLFRFNHFLRSLDMKVHFFLPFYQNTIPCYLIHIRDDFFLQFPPWSL